MAIKKSAEAIENRGNRGHPPRKRVCNCMKMLGLLVCNKQQRAWQIAEREGGEVGGTPPRVCCKKRL